MQQHADGTGRTYLAHQVHVAYVYPQLQGRGGNTDLDLARLEFLLGVQADFAGKAAVMGHDRILSQAGAHLVRHPLHQPPRVDEHQR